MPQVRPWLLLLALLTGQTVFAQRTVTVNNNCGSTIWPAAFPFQTNQSFGWEAAAGSSHTITLPDAWQGWIFGRTGCDFQSDPTGKCQTAGCSGLICDPNGAPGTDPFSRAVLLLDNANFDSYMIQLDTGFNLPMAISTNTSCPALGCAVNLNSNCPQPLKVTAKGTTVGCMTSCEAQIGSVDQNCCQGQFNAQAACNTSNIQYYDYFHDPCPLSHVSFYDPAVKICSSVGTSYAISFCPNPSILVSTGNTSSTTPGFPVAPGSTVVGSPHGSSPPSSSSTPAGTGSSGPSLGALIGIIVGAVAVITVVGVGAFLLWRRSRLRHRRASLAMVQPGGQDASMVALATSPAPVPGYRASMMYEAGGKRILQAAHPDDAMSRSSAPTTASVPASSPAQAQPPVDMQRIFENRALTSDLLRFIAHRMDAGPTDGPEQLDPPEYDDVLNRH